MNFANQTAYQVAVIAGNLDLAEVINQHRPDDVGMLSLINLSQLSQHYTCQVRHIIYVCTK